MFYSCFPTIQNCEKHYKIELDINHSQNALQRNDSYDKYYFKEVHLFHSFKTKLPIKHFNITIINIIKVDLSYVSLIQVFCEHH